MKVWLIDEEFNSHDVERTLINQELPELEIIESGYNLTEVLEKHGSQVTGILAQIYAKIDNKTMSRLPRLRAISVYGGGFNNVDVEFANSRKIIVTRVPDYCNHEVTEYVLANILKFAKRLDTLALRAKSGRWGAAVLSELPIDEWNSEKLQDLPQKVSGSTLLIIGYGKIGKMLAKKAEGLGMKVLAYDPYAENYEGAEMMGDIDEGLARADFVSIHALLTNETRGMLDAKRLRKMKRTAFLINSARGEIVNEKDLIEAVKNKTIRGAALDVLEGEPADLSREIFETPGILVTPHIAYISETSVQELKNRATTNLILALKGERPEDAVNHPT
jgi:D-3-phosphoglycerate dehydrogenase